MGIAGEVLGSGRNLAARLAGADSGEVAIEYGLIAVGIALAIVLGIEAVGVGVNDILVGIPALF